MHYYWYVHDFMIIFKSVFYVKAEANKIKENTWKEMIMPMKRLAADACLWEIELEYWRDHHD